MERCELLHAAAVQWQKEASNKIMPYLKWQKGTKYTYFTNLQLEKETSFKTVFSAECLSFQVKYRSKRLYEIVKLLQMFRLREFEIV